MKILYSRTQFWFGLTSGGSVGHTAGVIRGLSDFGEVEIIGNERPYGTESIPCTVVEPRFGKELLYNHQFYPSIWKKIREFMPDFVYHRYSGSSTATARACIKTGTPLVLEFNGSDVWVHHHWYPSGAGVHGNLRRALSGRILARNERYNLDNAYLISVVSEPLRDDLVAGGYPRERILVNPNAVDPDQFLLASPDRQREVKEELDIRGDRIVVGFSGSFGRWHGIPELAEAIVRINDDPVLRDTVCFVLYGDGELRLLIEERTAEFNNVLFAGVKDYGIIAEYLSICDIFVSPHGRTADGREFFGSPTKLFEYMAMGKGIVASRLGQIGEVLEDGTTAVLVEPGSVDELVAGIRHLVLNPDESRRLGENARAEVIGKHTWRHHAGRLVRAFKEIRTTGGIFS